MGGHGGSSGYSKSKAAEQSMKNYQSGSGSLFPHLKKKEKSNIDKAADELAELKIKLHNGEDIPEGYSVAKHNILKKYSIEHGPDGAGAVLKAADDIVAEREKKAAQKAAPENIKNLAGQAGNPWPPDAGKNHLEYQGGGGLGVWNQFGGGAKNGGVSSAKAKELYSAVDAFTGDYYGTIRSAMKKGDTTSQWGKKGALCEEFIAAGIKSGNGWSGGATYRGIGGLSDSALTAIHGMKAGDPIDCNFGAAASWSTKRSVSESFGSGYNHVTFVHLGSTQKGVSVTKIAHYGTGEQEVLVSKDAKYKVAAVVAGKVGAYSQTYVYVEDA